MTEIKSTNDAKQAHERLRRAGRLGWGMVLPFGSRAKSSAAAPSLAPPPAKQDLFRLMMADVRMGFVYDVPLEPGETAESYRARLHAFREGNADREIPGELVDALVSCASGSMTAADCARAAVLQLHQRNPQLRAPRGVSLVEPTKQRQGKEPDGWQITAVPGGQKRYQARTVVDDLKKHWTDDEFATALQLIKDFELGERTNLINSRAYDGMPGGGGSGGGKAGHIADGQRAAQARFNYVMKKVDPGVAATLASLILRVCNERDGKPQTAAEYGAIASQYKDSQCRVAFTAGALKISLRWAGQLYREFAREERQRRIAIENQRAQHEQALAERRARQLTTNHQELEKSITEALARPVPVIET